MTHEQLGQSLDRLQDHTPDDATLWDPLTLLDACHRLDTDTQLESWFTTVLNVFGQLIPATKRILLPPRDQTMVMATGPDLDQHDLPCQRQDPTEFPQRWVHWISIHQQPLELSHLASDNLRSDPYLLASQPATLIGLPLCHDRELVGIVILEHSTVNGSLSTLQLQILDRLSTHAARCWYRLQQQAQLATTLRIQTAELQNTQAKLDRLLGNSRLGIFTAEPETGRILDINQWGLVLLGFEEDPGEVGYVTDYFIDLLHWQDLTERLHHGLQHSATFVIDNYEIQLHQRGLWGLLSLSLNQEDGSIEGVITDITARKQAEMDLQKNAELVAQITDNLPALISYVDNQERYRFVNRYYEEWYGLPAEAIIDKHVRELVGEEDYFKGNGYAEAVLRGEKVSFELVRRRQDGQIRYLDINLIPHFDHNGSVLGYFVLAPDVTERRLAEEQYRSIFEGSSVGIFQSTTAGQFLSVNPALADLFGYESPEALISAVTNIEEELYVEPAQRARIHQGLAHQQVIRRLESQVYRQDRSIIWISETVWAVEDPEGQVLRYEGFVQDITERKQAEAEIHAQQEFLRNVIDACPYSIYVKAAEGYFVIINEAGANLLGHSVAEVQGHKDSEFIVEETQLHNFWADNHEVMQSLKPKFIPEQLLTSKDGSCRWLQTIIKPLITSKMESTTTHLIGVSVDITQRKQAETQLQEYLSLLKATLDSTADGIIATDLKGNPLTFNQKYLDLWDLSESFIQWETREERIEYLARYTRHPDEFLARVYQLMECEQTAFDLLELRDGRIFERYSQPQRMGLQVVGRVWSYRDITERQRIADALRESEARLRLALSAANMTAWDWDLITGEERWWPEADYLGGSGPHVAFLNYVHPDDRGSVQEAEQRALNQQAEYQVEFRVVLEDGSLRWKSSRGNLLYNRHGHPIRMVGTSIDITEQKTAEEALRRSEATNRALIEALPDLLLRMRADGMILGIKQSASIKSLLPVTHRDDFVSTEIPITTIFPADKAAERIQQVRQALATNELQVYEQQLDIEGESRYEEARIVVSSPNEVLIIIRDITDRKLSEAALQDAKEAAEAASLAKSTFLANMSHELRTPMNAILGFSQLMARDPDLTDQQKQSLTVINRSGEHLLSLINAVLEMSKIEAGRIVLHETAFDLTRLIQMLGELFQPRVKAKQLYLHFELMNNVPQYVITDESKLRQILINLLGNALKFTHVGGITVRVAYLEDLSLLQIDVQDTGEGIAPSERDKLFQPFMQTESGIKSQGGTGLGLAICRQYVELMGGSIQVDSQPAQGTCFQFTLQVRLADPYSLPVDQPRQRVVGLASGQPAYRILIVDDRQENRTLLSQLLETVGFETRMAADGRTAIQCWHDWDPHLIWMDMRMPEMDGYAATRDIKATEKGKNTVIIALTASTFEHERAQILAIGCDDFVAKPFQEHVIFEKMALHLNIRYTYESTVSTPDGSLPHRIQITQEQLTAWLKTQPQHWIKQLYEAALQLDTEVVQALLDTLPPSLEALHQTLADWVIQYRFDLITELAHPLLNPDTL